MLPEKQALCFQFYVETLSYLQNLIRSIEVTAREVPHAAHFHNDIST